MEQGHKVTSSITFNTEQEALIAFRSISVDPPPPRSSVTQKMYLDKNKLCCDFFACASNGNKKEQLCKMRVAVNSWLTFTTLLMDTIETFSLKGF